MWLAKAFFYLVVFLLFAAFVVTAILFLTSPYTWNSIDTQHDPSLTHATTGDHVNLTFKEKPYILKRSVQTKQLELLQTLTTCLRNNNCLFWAVKTTLLATVRHGRLIPWDDCLSIAILHDNLRTLVSLRTQLERSGTALLKHGKHAYYFCANTFTHYPYVEINIMEPKGNEISVCTPTDELGQCSFEDNYWRRREIFAREAVFPLQEAMLASVPIPIPQRPDECLQACFGADWKTQSLWKLTKVWIDNQYTRAIGRRFLPNYF